MRFFDKAKQIANSAKDVDMDTDTAAIDSMKEVELKTLIVKSVVSINYGQVNKLLKGSRFIKGICIPQIAISAVNTLETAVGHYNESLSKNKDDEFIDELVSGINACKVLDAIKPIAKFIPFGGMIIKVLKLLLNPTC